MSIAVSAVVHPSRSMRVMLAVHAGLHALAAVVIAGNLDGNFSSPAAVAACCLCASLVSVRAIGCAGTTRRIDISGLGQIRVTVQHDVRAEPMEGALVHLLPGSTVWPRLLLLLLRDEAGAVTVLAIFPDSVLGDAFRALQVAIGTIAAHGDDFYTRSKIL